MIGRSREIENGIEVGESGIESVMDVEVMEKGNSWTWRMNLL